MKISGPFFLFALFALISFSDDALAKQNNNFNTLFFPNKYAALVVDTNSGTILQEANANSKRYPASLTKMMTLYLTFEALRNNKLSMNEYVKVSRHAAAQPRMSLALKPYEKISIRDLVKSVVVLSANDSAVVLAEKIGGTENNFARIMTQRAHQLGMKNTNFTNASGLHNPRQFTTAKDMAKLLMAIKRDFPEYYSLLSTNFFTYKRQEFATHNNLMKSYRGAKAGKTGFIQASGFNLALNAEKNGSNIVGVVMGGRTARYRDNYMRTILDNNFSKLARNNTQKSRQYASNTINIAPINTASVNTDRTSEVSSPSLNSISYVPAIRSNAGGIPAMTPPVSISAKYASNTPNILGYYRVPVRKP